MGNSVTFKILLEKHPNRFVICTVDLRDAVTKRAKTFSILQTVRDTADMEKAIEYYQREGFKGVVAIPTFISEDAPDFPPRYAALLFRTIYHEEVSL